jgi:hypothetical protein
MNHNNEPPTNVDNYLATLPLEARPTLENLHRQSKPLPASLVKKIVKTIIRENETRTKQSK